MTGTCCRRLLPVHVPRQGLKFKTSAFLNSNFEICDNTLKLDMIGVDLPVNVNLNFPATQIQVELALQAPRQLLPCCRCARRRSDCQYRVASTALAG